MAIPEYFKELILNEMGQRYRPSFCVEVLSCFYSCLLWHTSAVLVKRSFSFNKGNKTTEIQKLIKKSCMLVFNDILEEKNIPSTILPYLLILITVSVALTKTLLFCIYEISFLTNSLNNLPILIPFCAMITSTGCLIYITPVSPTYLKLHTIIISPLSIFYIQKKCTDRKKQCLRK